jgi:hypothetical protein
MCSPASGVKGVAILYHIAVGHVHIVELDRNVALGESIPLQPVCVPLHINMFSNHNRLLELRKYFSEPLPIANMNIA